jgi:hypothetical protein
MPTFNMNLRSGSKQKKTNGYEPASGPQVIPPDAANAGSTDPTATTSAAPQFVTPHQSANASHTSETPNVEEVIEHSQEDEESLPPPEPFETEIDDGASEISFGPVNRPGGAAGRVNDGDRAIVTSLPAQSSRIKADQEPPTNTTEPSMKDIIMSFSKMSVSDSAFTPKPFRGGTRDAAAAEKWLRYFDNYTAFRGIEGDAKRQLFFLLMTDSEADWVRALPESTTADLNKLIEEFRKRHALTQVDVWARTVGLWERSQGQEESCDDYIAHMQLAAASIHLPEDQLCHIILKGLRDDTQMFCLQSGAGSSLEDIKKAARISEAAQAARRARTKEAAKFVAAPTAGVLTIRSDNQRDGATARQVTFNEAKNRDAGDQEQRRSSWKSTSSPTKTQTGGDHDTDRRENNWSSRSNSRNRRWNEGDDNEARPEVTQRDDKKRNDFRSDRNNQSSNGGGFRGNVDCRNCGRSHKFGRSHCYAGDLECFRCKKVGHLSRFCRSAYNNTSFNRSQNEGGPR